MTIEATERPHRTIGAGLGYNTSQGAAAGSSGKTVICSATPNI